MDEVRRAGGDAKAEPLVPTPVEPSAAEAAPSKKSKKRKAAEAQALETQAAEAEAAEPANGAAGQPWRSSSFWPWIFPDIFSSANHHRCLCSVAI